jgi:hypothetical protein
MSAKINQVQLDGLSTASMNRAFFLYISVPSITV